jgi:hypothetical protein
MSTYFILAFNYVNWMGIQHFVSIVDELGLHKQYIDAPSTF